MVPSGKESRSIGLELTWQGIDEMRPNVATTTLIELAYRRKNRLGTTIRQKRHVNPTREQHHCLLPGGPWSTPRTVDGRHHRPGEKRSSTRGVTRADGFAVALR